LTTVADPPRTAARQFRPLLAATGVSVVGDSVMYSGAPLLAAALTRDPLAIAAVSTATYLPWLIIGLPAGAVADRLPRRTVMITADLIRAAILIVLTVLIFTHRISVLVLVVAVAAVFTARCFFDPAAQGLIPVIIGSDPDDLADANGRFWSVSMTGPLAGPSLGSALFTLSRAAPPLADAVSFLASALLIRRLPRGDVSAPAGDRPPVRESVADGLRHLMSVADLRLVVFSSGAFNLAVAASEAVLVLIARDLLRLAAWSYGPLIMSAAAAGIPAGRCTGWLMRRATLRQVMAGRLALQGAAWAAVAAAPVWPVAVLAVAAIGASTTTGAAAGSSAVQAHCPGDMVGRVSSAWRVVAATAAGAGSVLGGIIASQWGLTVTMYVSAGLALTAAAVFGLHHSGVSPRPG
jgi:MFS family permease